MHASRIAVAAVAACASLAHAQSVEFRFIERTGRTAVTGPATAELNLAVQARVVNAPHSTFLSTFGFNIRLVDEPETNGTLARCLITNADHAYASDIALNNLAGRGGIAGQYSYLASLNSGLNGLINATGGAFTNTPIQEIGVVSGEFLGAPLLATPGVDADHDGNPDTWSGNGSGASPPNDALAAIDPVVAQTYLGASGVWIDVYRFRYTVSNLVSRTLVFHLDALQTRTATQLHSFSGLWGLEATTIVSATAPDLLVPIATTGPGTCCDVSTGDCAVTRASACTTGVFTAYQSCTPSPCPPPGRCCDGLGLCSTMIQAFCAGVWSTNGACTPNPCDRPGPCCTRQSACSVILQGQCVGLWSAAGTCSPSPCPPVGHCCASSGACSVEFQPLCVGSWFAGDACSPTNLCSLGACCNRSSFACTLSSPAACAAPLAFAGVGEVCESDQCPARACCSPTTHGCTSIAFFESCAAGWTVNPIGSACSPNLCPGIVCCDPISGFCSVTGPLGTCPAGRIPQGPGTSCTPVPCARILCCNPTTGSCSFVGGSGACPTGTLSQGPGTACLSTTCPQVVCCNALTGVCSIMGPGGTCAGTTPTGTTTCTSGLCPTVACCDTTMGLCSIIGPAGTCPVGATASTEPHAVCSPSPCPPAGRCCLLTGVCQYITHSACTGAWSAGSCAPNSCPQPLPCCTPDGMCVLLMESVCGANPRPVGTTCEPTPCAGVGACCVGHICTRAFATGCPPFDNRIFHGPGSVCGPPGNPIACCPANFNQNNGVEVQDVFDFLTAWFNHDMRTDFNHDNILSVLDVWSFVDAWHTGCS